MIDTASRVHLSVVIPVYRAADCVDELYRRLTKSLLAVTTSFEIILVDDGSPDESWPRIESLAAEDDRVRGLLLSRNFGQHHAVTAGLQASRGDWVVVMDCDLQDRPEEIPRLYAKATTEGHPCVMGRRTARKDGALKRLQSWAFYKLFAFLTDLPRFDGRVSNFSIASRQVVDDVNRLGEAVRFYAGSLFWLGYATAFVDVPHDPRFAGETSYTFAKLLRHSRNIILAHSTKPLGLCVSAGLAISALSFLTGLFYLGWTIVRGSTVQGWPTLIISIYLSTGTIILTLGILGLYIGRIFTEVKGRPLYVVRKRTDDV